MKKKGILFVLSGPSGAGKGTVLDKVLSRVSDIAISVSVTTRSPRQGEIEGLHYHFRTREEFQEMVDNNEFLEYVAKFRNKYGTPKAQVEELLAKGTDVILEIETRGATKVRKAFPHAVLIFITPSNYEELSRRLDMRGSENEKTKQLRLKIAKSEFKSMKHYDYVAINDDLEECANTVKAIITAERSSLKRKPEVIESFANIQS